jgi:Lon-like protease
MRLLRAVFMPISVAILVTAAFLVPLPVFVEQPGEPVSLGASVVVESPDAEDLSGDFLLTAVNVRRGTVVRLVGALFDDDVVVTDARRLIPPGERDETYFERQRAVFRESVDVAAAVGLEAAGFAVDPEAITGSGVLVVRVLEGSPAEGVLEPGDVIVAVDGEDVQVTDDLRGLIARDADDRPRQLRVRRDDAEVVASVVPGDIAAASGAPIRGIGVEIQTLDPRIDLPVPVRVDSGRIGGPSAGLMMALTVFDKAAVDVDLAAGRQIAGTGMLSPGGEVGPIGGITQKVVAAQRRDVDVFLSPAVQVERARSALVPGSRLEVIGVATFEEAVAALRDAARTALAEVVRV